MLMDDKKTTLRLRIYSTKSGGFKGNVGYFVDLPSGIAAQVIAYCLPHGKAVPQSKLTP